MMKRQGTAPGNNFKKTNSFVCTVAVNDVDDVVAIAEAASGSVDMPADDVPGVGRLAYIRGTEGNMLGLLKPMEGGAGM